MQTLPQVLFSRYEYTIYGEQIARFQNCNRERLDISCSTLHQ